MNGRATTGPWPRPVPRRQTAPPSTAPGGKAARLRPTRRWTSRSPSTLDERQQVLVHLVLVRRAYAVGRARIDLEGRILHELGRQHRRVGDRHDLVVVAVEDQR